MSQNKKLNNNQLNRADIDSYKKLDKFPIILILDNIRSAINVGSIFRSADAFNVQKIFLSGITACPPNKDILKSALGATESVDWEYVNDAQELLSNYNDNNQYEILSIEQTENSIKLDHFLPSPQKKYLLILGNEVDGVSQELINLSAASLEIPQYGTKHSLNVAVTAGIVLWDFHCKLNLQNA
jgi:tRNA G18 (ribose-2'-O)-methylase SpoU